MTKSKNSYLVAAKPEEAEQTPKRGNTQVSPSPDFDSDSLPPSDVSPLPRRSTGGPSGEWVEPESSRASTVAAPSSSMSTHNNQVRPAEQRQGGVTIGGFMQEGKGRKGGMQTPPEEEAKTPQSPPPSLPPLRTLPQPPPQLPQQPHLPPQQSPRKLQPSAPSGTVSASASSSSSQSASQQPHSSPLPPAQASSSAHVSPTLPPSSSPSPPHRHSLGHGRYLVTPSSPGPLIHVSSGHFSMQGIRHEMEDRVTLLPHPEFNRVASFNDGLTRSFWAVFDGHGGDVSAEYCRQHVHNNLMMQPAFLEGSPVEGLRHALQKTEEDFVAACRRINLLTSSGTTAITAYLQANHLVVGNIGDSRAVLSRLGRAVDASVDHKPGRKDEQERIEALGGRVGISEEDAFRVSPRPCPCIWDCLSAGRPLRVFPGGLSVSRTIGDISMKTTHLVSSEPDMWEEHLTPQDEFLILACDGVWDVMNSQQAVDCVRGHLYRHRNNVEEAAKHLANEAFRKGSSDNISVVLVQFTFPQKDGQQGQDQSTNNKTQTASSKNSKNNK